MPWPLCPAARGLRRFDKRIGDFFPVAYSDAGGQSIGSAIFRCKQGVALDENSWRDAGKPYEAALAVRSVERVSEEEKVVEEPAVGVSGDILGEDSTDCDYVFVMSYI